MGRLIAGRDPLKDAAGDVGNAEWYPHNQSFASNKDICSSRKENTQDDCEIKRFRFVHDHHE